LDQAAVAKRIEEVRAVNAAARADLAAAEDAAAQARDLIARTEGALAELERLRAAIAPSEGNYERLPDRSAG
jgi:multidrug resistance efflux pump